MSSHLPKIYTTGYTGKDIDDLPHLLNSLDAVLIDIRFDPQKASLRWTSDYLQLLLKRRYLHVPALGVREFRARQTGIQNLRLGIGIVERLGINCLLMCECESFENCHRRVIGDELRHRAFEVRETSDWQPINQPENI